MRDEIILSAQEADSRRFKFYGLVPGQYEHVILPTNPNLPFPIYFRFLLEQRTILRVQTEIGWSHRGIEKLLEGLDAETACHVIRTVNPLCPNHFESAYRRAIGLPGLDRLVLSEESKQYHLYFIRRILERLEENSLLRLSHLNCDQWIRKLRSSKSVKSALSGKGSILHSEAISYGLSGPTLEACKPPHKGDAWSRLLVKLDQIANPNPEMAPEGLLTVTVTGERVRIRTPSFFHAAALETLLIGSQLPDLEIILASLGMVGTEIDR